jgi:hypothetical protein
LFVVQLYSDYLLPFLCIKLTKLITQSVPIMLIVLFSI